MFVASLARLSHLSRVSTATQPAALLHLEPINGYKLNFRELRNGVNIKPLLCYENAHTRKL